MSPPASSHGADGRQAPSERHLRHDLVEQADFIHHGIEMLSAQGKHQAWPGGRHCRRSASTVQHLPLAEVVAVLQRRQTDGLIGGTARGDRDCAAHDDEEPVAGIAFSINAVSRGVELRDELCRQGVQRRDRNITEQWDRLQALTMHFSAVPVTTDDEATLHLPQPLIEPGCASNSVWLPCCFTCPSSTTTS